MENRRCLKYMVIVICLGFVVLLSAHPTQAASITFTGSNGTLSASAIFDLTGTALTVTLTNTSAIDTTDPAQILHTVFFDTNGVLTPTSANLNGSTVYYGSIVNNVGEGWVYNSPITQYGFNAGISSAGLGVFDNSGFFYTPGVTPVDGANYGILSAGDNSATFNGGFQGPLIKNSVQFVLNVDSNFTLSGLGNDVAFQFGTTLDDAHFPGCTAGVDCSGVSLVPEPTSLLLIGTGLAGIALIVRKRTR